ncbi:phosphotransferase [Paenibacillus hamazuiensis]|uniref:phosphotransferase n=1 Tax=Paenibacillus hamazuiensis TaxID=2936508 RepID=UPI00200CBACC|nr:phosphotransferase [Paenibacillus hamazuiensis]
MLQDIINEIMTRALLPEPVTQWSELKGGTMSMLGVLGTPEVSKRYVVKINPRELVRNETRFLNLYDGIDLLPSVRYVDPEFRYFVYDFIPGDTRYEHGAKTPLMQKLTRQVISRYVRPESGDHFKHVESRASMEESISYASSVIGANLPPEDHELVAYIMQIHAEVIANEDKYILHGDFGAHNFLFTEGKLSGVIDPIPAIGRKRYDLLYAFCSSPDELTMPALIQTVSELETVEEIDRKVLIGDMLLALYSRLSTCLKYHPKDLIAYLQAWSYWTLHWKNS